jgi:lipid-binding SYLF domain-containing protein
MPALTRRIFVSTATLGIATAAIRPALAGPEHQEVVDKAKATVDNFHLDADYPEFKKILHSAKGVLVFPSLIKAGFIFGGEGGSGVLVAHGASGWSYPAFYTMGSGSFGLQIGVQDAEVILALMTEKGMEQVMKSQFKLGADASIAVGPKGVGVEAATTGNFGADILSYAKTRGAFGGGSFEGSVIYGRDDWNANYYGHKMPVQDIVLHAKVSNSGAEALRSALAAKA